MNKWELKDKVLYKNMYSNSVNMAEVSSFLLFKNSFIEL